MKKKEKIWWSASTLVDKHRNVFKGPSVFIWWHAKKVLWRRDRLPTPVFLGFPCGSAGKESTCNVGDLGSIPGLGRSPGEGIGYPLQCSWASLVVQTVKNPPAMPGDLGLIPRWGRSPGEGKGYPLQYSGLENPMGWIVPRVTKSRTRLSDFNVQFL